MNRDLSVIIPVYNGADFIAETVHRIQSYLEKATDLSFEIIVVNDGSTDDTQEVMNAFSSSQIISIECPQNRGKFAAIRRGMQVARGRCRVFTDADLPYDLEAFPYITHLINHRGLHLVVGDRTLPDSIYSDRLSPTRSVVTKLFTLFVRLLVVSGLYDTQCGLKGIRGDLADDIFPLLKDDGFSGDVELLYVALKYNLEVKRIPVRLQRSGHSTVHVMKHGILMLRRIFTLRVGWRRGDYNSEALKRASEQRYWTWSGMQMQHAQENRYLSESQSQTRWLME